MMEISSFCVAWSLLIYSQHDKTLIKACCQLREILTRAGHLTWIHTIQYNTQYNTIQNTIQFDWMIYQELLRGRTYLGNIIILLWGVSWLKFTSSEFIPVLDFPCISILSHLCLKYTGGLFNVLKVKRILQEVSRMESCNLWTVLSPLNIYLINIDVNTSQKLPGLSF